MSSRGFSSRFLSHRHRFVSSFPPFFFPCNDRFAASTLVSQVQTRVRRGPKRTPNTTPRHFWGRGASCPLSFLRLFLSPRVRAHSGEAPSNQSGPSGGGPTPPGAQLMHSNVTPEGNCPALFPESSLLAVLSRDEKPVGGL